MASQDALEPTNMCLWGLMPSWPSKPAAGAATMPSSGMVVGPAEPHTLQKVRTPLGDD